MGVVKGALSVNLGNRGAFDRESMIVFAGTSATGCVRDHNEDYIGADPENRFFIVADGMGGENCGEVASKLTVTEIARFLESSFGADHESWPFGYDNSLSSDENRLITACGLANQKERLQAGTFADCKDMGSTVVAVCVTGATAVVASVGDSRAYLLRENILTQMTTDDTLVEALVAEGAITREQAMTHPKRNIVTAAIGALDSLEVQTLRVPLQPHDRLLLCTDGVHGVLSDAEILRNIGVDGSLEVAVNDLAQLVIQRGAPDNLSCILMEYQSDNNGKTGSV